MPGVPSSAELRLPQCSNAVSTTIGYSLVLILMAVAICNLVFIQVVPIATAIASVLCLLLVMWIVVDDIRKEGGLRNYIIKRLGAWSGQHLVRATPEQNAETISFGFLMFDQFLSYLTVDVKSISSINWSPGQATALAGRDMRDWHVAVWYHNPDRPRRKFSRGAREEEIFLIGDSGPRETLEAFGHEFLQFLIAVGVELRPGRDDREFIGSSSTVVTGQSDEREPPMAGTPERNSVRRNWFVFGMVIPVLMTLTLTSGLFQWSRLNCRHEDVDINTGRIRYTRYLLFCPIGSRTEDTWLSRARLDSTDTPDWHRVNTFSPGVGYSPHHLFHGAVQQIDKLQYLDNMIPFDPSARRRIAETVLSLWQRSRSDVDSREYIDKVAQTALALSENGNSIFTVADLPTPVSGRR